MKSTKYYVVWKGRKTGIFTTWAECKQQVDKFADAKYKSFKTKAQAQSAFNSSPPNYYSSKSKSKANKSVTITTPSNGQIIEQSISVDASCLGNPGIMEYQGVETMTKKILFRHGPMNNGTNNIGEFLALVDGLAYLQDHNQLTMPIYSDSKIAIGWVRKKQPKTTLKPNYQNQEIFTRLENAIDWLKNNSYTNPILKWETRSWGEIPADFGRK